MTLKFVFALTLVTLALTLSFSTHSQAAKMLVEDPINGECTDGTMMEMAECLSSTLAIADHELNTVYNSMRTKLQGYAQTTSPRMNQEVAVETERRLVQAQRAWIGYRDSECEFQGSQMLGGSGQGLAVTQCRLQETRERVRELKAFTL